MASGSSASKTVAVVGAGIQGCCIALRLAERGVRVDLFDEAEAPMDGASRWNEGKLHLGYVYANDPTMATATAMVTSACQFDLFFREVLGQSIPGSKQSSRFIYGVHKNSLLNDNRIRAYFSSVDRLLQQRDKDTPDYLGQSHDLESSELSVEPFFNPGLVRAAYQSPERSVDTHFIADLLTGAVQAHPRIQFLPHRNVQSLERDKQGCFFLHTASGAKLGRYQHLVNTTWNNRLALDASLGYQPSGPWLHRYKLALHLKKHPQLAGLPSCTFLLGPFGDLVNFSNGNYYLSWYPVCKVGASSSLQPPDYTQSMSADDNVNVALETQSALADLIPALDRLPIDFAHAQVKGGHIFAWGDSDITQLSSQLHSRHRVGIFSNRGYHSVNTGKYGMAPMHAMELVHRICG